MSGVHNIIYVLIPEGEYKTTLAGNIERLCGAGAPRPSPVENEEALAILQNDMAAGRPSKIQVDRWAAVRVVLTVLNLSTVDGQIYINEINWVEIGPVEAEPVEEEPA